MLLETYRLCRSNALWFAHRTDGHSITVRDGLTFTFKKGEMKRWAKYWLDKSRESWEKLLSVPGAAVSWCGSSDGNATNAKIADSQRETSGCICPTCTIIAIKGLN